MDAEHARDRVVELDYWQALLDDLSVLNDDAEKVAAGMADGVVALVSLVSLTDTRANEFVKDGLDATNKGLKAMMGVQERLDNIIRLIDGRAKMLRAELSA